MLKVVIFYHLVWIRHFHSVLDMTMMTQLIGHLILSGTTSCSHLILKKPMWLTPHFKDKKTGPRLATILYEEFLELDFKPYIEWCNYFQIILLFPEG